jgi:hypothetical protein
VYSYRFGGPFSHTDSAQYHVSNHHYQGTPRAGSGPRGCSSPLLSRSLVRFSAENARSNSRTSDAEAFDRGQATRRRVHEPHREARPSPSAHRESAYSDTTGSHSHFHPQGQHRYGYYAHP